MSIRTAFTNRGFAASILLLLMACLIVVLGLGYFLGKAQAKPPALTQAVSAVPNPTTAASATPPKQDLTAAWKTFTSSRKDYQIKYPSDSFVRLVCPNEELTLIARGNQTDETRTMTDCSREGQYTVEIITNPQNSTPPQSTNYFTVTEDPVTVGGLATKKYISHLTGVAPWPAPIFSEDVLVNHGGAHYWLHLEDESLAPTFDIMLKTFTFL